MDAVGRPIALAGPPERIVCLIPSITETLFRLGAGDRVVGISKYCTEPAEGVAAKEKVGGEKNPDIPKILSLHPDLVIVNVEENRKEDVDRMEAAGVRLYVTYPRTVREGIAMIRDLGALVAAEDASEGIAARLDAILDETERLVAGRRPPRVFCPIWRRPYMAVNGDTFVDAVITACGGQNIFKGHAERYPRVTLEEVAARDPEVILLPDEPYPFAERHLEDFRPFGTVAAVREGRIHLLDGKIVTWYGPRIGESLLALRQLLWPDL